MKPTNNPYHSKQLDFPFSPEETGALGTLKEGLEYELDDLVKLELTAEQMLGDEVQLVRAYVKEDAHGFWEDIKTGLVEFEVATGDWLLSAADPTRVNWQLNHWWGDDEVHLH